MKRDQPLRFVESPDGGQTAIGRIAGGWAYQMSLLRQNGRWVIGELRLFPDSGELSPSPGKSEGKLVSALVPPGGLTTRHLRSIPFGRNSAIASLARLDAIALQFKANFIRTSELESRHRALVRRLKALRGDVRYALVARCYVDVQARGSKKQNVEVAKQLRLKPSQVRDAIHWARRRGLLTTTRQKGLSGGVLTPEAHELLESLDRVKKNRRLADVFVDVLPEFKDEISRSE